MPLVILNGASGAGKTAIVEAIERRPGNTVQVFCMDREGVPPVEAMVAQYGSTEAWQRAVTFDWMRRLAPLVAEGQDVVFDGQSRFSFLSEAVAHEGITAVTFILVDCDDATRTARLTGARGQPELANADMMNWARALRRGAAVSGADSLDTSDLSIDDAVEFVLRKLRPDGYFAPSDPAATAV